MAGDDKPTFGGVKTPKPLMRRGIAEKDAWGLTRSELMRSSRGNIRITKTTEDMEVIVRRRCAIESLVRGQVSEGFSGKNVK